MAVSKKVLEALAIVFALPAAFLLILVVLPGAWSIVVGDASSEGWAEIGNYVILTISLGAISTLLQHAARHPSPPSDVAEHDAKPQLAREREPMTSTPSPASFQRALVALFVETDGHLAVAGHDLQATDEILKSYEGVDVPWEEVWRVASNRHVGVPPFGSKPYWAATGLRGNWVPQTILAFWGTDARVRIAADSRTHFRS